MKNIKLLCLLCSALFIFILCLSGCRATTTGAVNSDFSTYVVPLHLADYKPQINAAKYSQLGGKKLCFASIRNDARNTTNFNYYSRDHLVKYQFSNNENTIVMLVANYFWYAYQKAFAQAGVSASTDCSDENTPELWIFFHSLNDEELQMKVSLIKKGEPIYEKNFAVRMPPVPVRNTAVLQKSGYKMTDLTVEKILDDKGFQDALLK